MVASYYSTSLFRSCPMKWRWRYVKKLEPRRKYPALTLGASVHDAFDMSYHGSSLNDILIYLDTVYAHEKSVCHPDDYEQLLLDHYTAKGIFTYYPNKNHQFEQIKSEEEFDVPVRNGLHFIGRVDGLVKHQGVWWIRELKITGMSTKQFEGRASCSSQATGYIYAMKKKTGLNIDGVIYDACCKPRLRKRVDETADDFGKRIYNDYANPKNLSRYFLRHYTYRSPLNLQQFEEDLLGVCDQIEKCKRHDIFYRNTDACWVYGTECPYRKICFSDNLDPDIIDLYYERRKENGGTEGSRSTRTEGSKGSEG